MFQVEVEKVLYGTGKQADKRPEKDDAQKAKSAARKRTRYLFNIRKKEAVEARKAAKDAANRGVEEEGEDQWEQFNRDIKGLDASPKFQEGRDQMGQVNKILYRIRQLQKRINSDGKLDRVGTELANDIKYRVAQLLGGLPKETKFADMINDFKMLLANRDTMLSEVIEDAEKQSSTTNAESAAAPAAPAEGGEEATAEDATAAKTTHSQTRRIDKASASVGLTKEQAERLRATLDNDEFKLSNEAMRSIAKFIREQEENPIDESKPYKTPWEPRPFMSAFAFIPRYLEVNPNICAAVYLRHPVARKGMAEVPTPFSYLTNQLAHNWYLARGPRIRN